MQIKEITVGYTYTKNQGNYESLKVDGSLTIAVNDYDNIDELSDKAYKKAKQQVKRGLQVFKEDN